MRSASKNMCSVRQRPMPSAPKRARRARIGGRLGVGAHLQPAHLVGPAHQRREIAGELRLDRRHLAQHHLAGRAVDGDDVAVLHDRRRARVIVRACVVDAQLAGAGDAGPAHAARDHGGVAGHAAARGQDAGGGVHAVDVLRAGLDPHQDHRARPWRPRSSASSAVNTTAPDGGARRGRQARAR